MPWALGSITQLLAAGTTSQNKHYTGPPIGCTSGLAYCNWLPPRNWPPRSSTSLFLVQAEAWAEAWAVAVLAMARGLAAEEWGSELALATGPSLS